MKGYISNLEKETLENTDFRRVLYTGKHSQLVLMNIKPGQEIGNEIHTLDQFIRVERGAGRVELNNGEVNYELSDGSGLIISAGTWHNVINIGPEDLKIYTIYSPPEHKDGTVHHDKADQQEEHFDGKTTE